MIRALDPASVQDLGGFEHVIDVRSPAEFAIDHVPGAINLPVLDDEERARVGTIYVQRSHFEARRLGAALVARNIARHLETALQDAPPNFAPLVYCWRGGQRSNAMATVLDQIGWRPTILAGGYKTYRRLVAGLVQEGAPAWRVVLLSGPTGAGKTEILRACAGFGVQTLDLEGAAEHRGSLLGALPGERQPSQRMFESRLAAVLTGFDPERPILIEAESSKVGQVMVPGALWKAMSVAPRIEVAAPASARAAFLAANYQDWLGCPEALTDILDRLPGPHSKADRAAWRALAEAGDASGLAEALVVAHYDPAYARSARKIDRAPIACLELPAADPAAFEDAARTIADLLKDSIAA